MNKERVKHVISALNREGFVVYDKVVQPHSEEEVLKKLRKCLVYDKEYTK